MHLRSNQETCQRLRKQLASQSQVGAATFSSLLQTVQTSHEKVAACCWVLCHALRQAMKAATRWTKVYMTHCLHR